MYSFRKSKKGFTLIELMVVVAIIAVLALLGLRMYSTQQTKAKIALVKANAGTVQVTIQTELVDNPALTLTEVLDTTTLTDLNILHNPFTGAVGVGVDKAVNNVNAVTVGMVGVDYSNNQFIITGYEVGGAIIGNYTLTAQP